MRGIPCQDGCGLAPRLAQAQLWGVSEGRMAASARVDRSGEESPGSTEMRCRVTPGGGDPRDSATENRPPVPVRQRRRG